MIKQYTLGVRWRDDASFDNFYQGDNRPIVSLLHDLLAKRSPYQGLFLWGAPAAGCSHLLQACCQQLPDQPVVYLPLSHADCRPEMLEGLTNMGLVCLDDLDWVMGDEQWELALFNLYNQLQQSTTRYLLAGHCPPTQMPIQLKDLRSRLNSLLTLELKQLTDQQKIHALHLRARHRGLVLPQEVAAFLIHHYPRDMASLMEALEQLDRSSLAEKRHLTIPFAKQVLDI